VANSNLVTAELPKRFGIFGSIGVIGFKAKGIAVDDVVLLVLDRCRMLDGFADGLEGRGGTRDGS